MSISEQVKELRTIANNLSIGHNMPISLAIEHFRKAADTIEVLSSKLQVANMENGGKWIAVEDRLPDKDDTVLIDTGIGYFEIATYSGDGKTFYTEECGSSCPVAWQYLPEPYCP